MKQQSSKKKVLQGNKKIRFIGVFEIKKTCFDVNHKSINFFQDSNDCIKLNLYRFKPLNQTSPFMYQAAPFKGYFDTKYTVFENAFFKVSTDLNGILFPKS